MKYSKTHGFSTQTITLNASSLKPLAAAETLHTIKTKQETSLLTRKHFESHKSLPECWVVVYLVQNLLLVSSIFWIFRYRMLTLKISVSKLLCCSSGETSCLLCLPVLSDGLYHIDRRSMTGIIVGVCIALACIVMCALILINKGRPRY